MVNKWLEKIQKLEQGKSLKVQAGDSTLTKNPKDTVRIKYATVADARATARKVKNINKPFARKIQILTVMEQRAKVAGKNQQAQIAKRAKEAIRRQKKTR